MQLFILDESPEIAASYLCNRHVVKMPIEAAQIGSTVLHLQKRSVAGLYKPTHIHHPCVKWCLESEANMAWAIKHGIAAAFEYQKRYGKVHGSMPTLQKLYSLLSCKDHIEHTTFVQAMPVEYRLSRDAVKAYRNYYRKEKAGFAKWKTVPPSWFIEDSV